MSAGEAAEDVWRPLVGRWDFLIDSMGRLASAAGDEIDPSFCVEKNMVSCCPVCRVTWELYPILEITLKCTFKLLKCTYLESAELE
jgi:hypothetical protein